MKLLVTVAPFSTLQISENAVQKGVVQSVLPTTGASNERYEASHVKHAFKSPPVAKTLLFQLSLLPFVNPYSLQVHYLSNQKNPCQDPP